MTPTTRPESTPDELFRSFAAAEGDVRSAVRGLVRQRSDEVAIRRCALSLELLLGTACLLESLAEIPASGGSPAIVFTRVQQRCGLNLQNLVRDAQQEFGQRRPPEIPDLTPDLIRREVQSAVAFLPIDEIERTAAALGISHLGHRCRIAYAGLQAFLLRGETTDGGRLQVLGQKYSEGTLSVEEIATVLGLEVHDAIALLDERGFQRSLDVIALDPNDRNAILERMRADRLLRENRPATDPTAPARSVIASERIEGVDARRWILPQRH